MLLPSLLSLVFVHSALRLHYQFWADPGQSLTDQSGNGVLGVNGDTSMVESLVDALATARGFYFGLNRRVAITTPNIIAIPMFTIVAWVLPFGDSALFTYDPSSGLFKWTLSGSPTFVMRTTTKTGTSLFTVSSFMSVQLGAWDLYAVEVVCGMGCQVTGYVHNFMILNSSTPMNIWKASTSQIGPGDFFMYELKIYSSAVSLPDLMSEYAASGSGGCPGSCSSLCVIRPEVLCLSSCGYTSSDASRCAGSCGCKFSQCLGTCRMCLSTCSLANCSELTTIDCASSELCHHTCLTCGGYNRNQCVSCYALNSLIVAGECVCAHGFYMSSERPMQCSPCHGSCDTCDGETEKDCLTCREYAGLNVNRLCVCNEGSFLSGFDCFPCHYFCGSCFGGLETECFSCKDRASLDENRRCVCPIGSFPSPDAANCRLCDSTCLECAAEGPNQCSKCNPSRYLIGSAPNACACNPGFFTDSSDCVPCNDSCATCVSLGGCQTCRENAELRNGECICIDGNYRKNSDCVSCTEKCALCNEFACVSCKFGLFALGAECTDVCPIGFRIDATLMVCEQGDISPPVPSLSVSTDNNLFVHFDKPMHLSLVSSDVAIRVASASSIDFQLTWSDPGLQDPQNIAIILTFESSWIPVGCIAELTFLNPDRVKDVYGVPINITSITAYLNPIGMEPESVATLMRSDFARIAANAGKAGVSASLVASLMNSSPSSIISLINQIQLITYLAMTKLPLTEDFAATLAALNVGFMLPNPLSAYINIDTETIKPPQFAVNYGVDSTLFVSNSYAFLGCCGLFALAFFPIYLFSKSKNRIIRDFCNRKLSSYQWGIPLNLWLTSFLDLGVFALLHIRNTPIHFLSGFIVLSWVLSGAVVICVAATPTLLIAFMYRNFKLIVSQSDATFNTRWATFFQQFKPSYSLASTGYYPLFAIRRVVLAITLTLTYDFLIVNALVNTAIGVVSFLFLVVYRPFKVRLDLVEAEVIECGTVTVYIFASFFAFDISPDYLNLIGLMGMCAVFIAIAANVAFSLLRTAFSLISVFKHYRNRAKSVQLRYQVRDI